MYARADLLECEVVVQGTIAGEQRGAYRFPDGTFQMDRLTETKTDAELRTLAATVGQELTWTCVPPGSGERIGVDRDADGFFDGDERDAGSDPVDPVSIPPTLVRTSVMQLRDSAVAGRQRIVFRSAPDRGTPSGVILPTPGGASDPAVNGAQLTVYGTSSSSVITLPVSRWSQGGSASSPRWLYLDAQRLDGPISKVSLRAGRLIVRGRGATLYSLAGAPQGIVSIRLKLGTGIEFCAAAPPKTPATSNDTTVKFIGARNTAAPAVCPPVP
jgi:hypothetical protein